MVHSAGDAVAAVDADGDRAHGDHGDDNEEDEDGDGDGACVCDIGFTGRDCDVCAEGWYSVSSSNVCSSSISGHRLHSSHNCSSSCGSQITEALACPVRGVM